MKPYFVFLTVMLLLAACTTSQQTQKTQIEPISMAGLYTGLLPCDGCPGIEVELELKDDFTFIETSTFQERDVRPITVYGKWNLEKNNLQLHYTDHSENLRIENSKLFKLSKQNQKLNTSQPGYFVFGLKNESINPLSPSLDGKWVMLTLNGQTYTNPRDANRHPFINFSTNEFVVNGNTGCNNYHGKFVLEGNKLTIGPTMAMTKMGCLDTFENLFINSLISIDSYQLHNQQLSLFSAGNQVMVFEKENETK